jgi:hypothetical protein
VDVDDGGVIRGAPVRLAFLVAAPGNLAMMNLVGSSSMA